MPVSEISEYKGGEWTFVCEAQSTEKQQFVSMIHVGPCCTTFYQRNSPLENE